MIQGSNLELLAYLENNKDEKMEKTKQEAKIKIKREEKDMI